jgi:hypothetical protein
LPADTSGTSGSTGGDAQGVASAGLPCLRTAERTATPGEEPKPIPPRDKATLDTIKPRPHLDLSKATTPIQRQKATKAAMAAKAARYRRTPAEKIEDQAHSRAKQRLEANRILGRSKRRWKDLSGDEQLALIDMERQHLLGRQ